LITTDSTAILCNAGDNFRPSSTFGKYMDPFEEELILQIVSNISGEPKIELARHIVYSGYFVRCAEQKILKGNINIDEIDDVKIHNISAVQKRQDIDTRAP
jgi:hypothetical protein